ncbi:protein rep, partial [Staphylococcus epidermidis]|uniref:protein rep n=1 Tax=Staphylococcus epidermidis TaxID=1282 RepID=UPI00164289B5
MDESGKYGVKDIDFRRNEEENNLKGLCDLEEGLEGKRLMCYGGLVKEIDKKLNVDDWEDGDLIDRDDEEKGDE